MRVFHRKSMLWAHLCRRIYEFSLLQAQSCGNHYIWKGKAMYCTIAFLCTILSLSFMGQTGGYFVPDSATNRLVQVFWSSKYQGTRTRRFIITSNSPKTKLCFTANALMSKFMVSNIFTRYHMPTFWNTAKVFPGWIIFLIDISLYDARFIITFNRFLKTVCFCWCIWKREIFSPY